MIVGLPLRCVLGVGFAIGLFQVSWATEFRSSPTAPGTFPPLPACRLTYAFGWSDLIDAATATVNYRPGNEDLRVKVEGRTIGLARLLWRMDARHDAIIDRDQLRGRWLEQYEVYRNRNIETRVAFNGVDGVQRFRRVNPDPELSAKWKRIRIEEPFDILGGVLFVRSQPLNDGDHLKIIGFPGDSAYQIELNVVLREKLRIMEREIPAIRLDLRIQKIEFKKNRPIGLTPHQRFRSGTVWISDDNYRIPLRAEVSVFIGSVTGQLIAADFY